MRHIKRCRRAVRVAAMLALALQGTAQAAESFVYDPPDREPKGARTRYFEGDPDEILQTIWTFLEEKSLQIETVNPTDRLIVARYSGTAGPYVDCGKVEHFRDGKPHDPPRIYSANKDEVRTYREVKGRRYGIMRKLKLDARLLVRVEPRGKGARVFSEVIYVATKLHHRVRKGGVPDELINREVVSFNSGSSGTFEKGTVCLSNGRLENLPLQPLLPPS